MYQQTYPHHHGIRDESVPRPRQPSSTSSTLLTPSEGSDAWMPNSRSGLRGSTSTTTGTSQSIISDGEDHDTYKEEEGDQVTEVGTVDMPKLCSNYEQQDEDRPLIDFGQQPQGLNQVREPMPTPGDKLRMLLRQMEAEVRNTTPAPTPVLITTSTPRHTRRPSISRDISEDERETPAPASKSHWREGRRIGALPKERSYSPISSPERPIARPDAQEHQEEEEMEILEDSPPTPPLRITNPYMYNNRKTEERRSLSPRISSRAAVLHASTSRSPDPPTPHQPTPLESYLARAPTSPSRKGKERALDYTPQRTSPITSTSRTTIRTKSTKTPRKWSVEIAPDDSVLFAEGIPAETEQVELDVDESVEPPWEDTDDASGSGSESENSPKKSFATARDGRSRTLAFESPDISLPALPEIQASFGSSSGDEEEEMVPVIARPTSRTRSRYSQSRSHEDSLLAQQNTHSQSQTRSLRQSLSPPTRQSPSKTINQSTSFTTAKSTSPSFHLNRSSRLSAPVKAVFPQDIQVGMSFTPAPTLPAISTPPRVERPQAQVEPTPMGQTPKPPGAWFSASKLQPRGGRGSKFVPSPSPLGHRSSPTTQEEGDTSIHRIKLSPARTRPTSASPDSVKRKDKEAEEGDISITQRLITLSKSLSLTSRKETRIPKPSTTLIEARLALARAAEASAIAQRKVENSQKDWLKALSSGTAVDVIRQGWSWGKWAWWISMEILLLWGVFRVTLEYASMAQFRPFDPSSSTGPSLALSVPLPTAVSAFIIPHRTSVNFFDLLESLELWRFLGVVGVDDPGGRLLIPV